MDSFNGSFCQYSISNKNSYNQNGIFYPQNICQSSTKKIFRMMTIKEGIYRFFFSRISSQNKSWVIPKNSKMRKKRCQNSEFCCHHCQKSFK